MGRVERETELDGALRRFVDATMRDDLPGARVAFADAQAHGLREAGLEAELWAAVELRAAAALPDDLTNDAVADAVLRALHRGVQ